MHSVHDPAIDTENDRVGQIDGLHGSDMVSKISCGERL
jgi:hypothetical protein